MAKNNDDNVDWKKYALELIKELGEKDETIRILQLKLESLAVNAPGSIRVPGIHLTQVQAITLELLLFSKEEILTHERLCTLYRMALCSPKLIVDRTIRLQKLLERDDNLILQAVQVHIHALRKKFHPLDIYILTFHGTGYGIDNFDKIKLHRRIGTNPIKYGLNPANIKCRKVTISRNLMNAGITFKHKYDAIDAPPEEVS